MKSFLENNKFENKIIVPLFTFSGGANKNKVINEIKNLTNETMNKQHFNITKFIEYLDDNDVVELTDKNVKKQLRQYRRYCLKKRGNKRTTVKTYMMNILEFINSEEVQEDLQHETIKMKDIIEVKVEDPETAKKRIEKISLTRKQSKYFLDTISLKGNKRDYAICSVFLDSGVRLKELVNMDKSDIQVPLNEDGFFVLPDDVGPAIKTILTLSLAFTLPAISAILFS